RSSLGQNVGGTEVTSAVLDSDMMICHRNGNTMTNPPTESTTWAQALLVLGPPGVRRLLERGTAAVPWGIVSTIGPPPLHCDLHRGEHADDEHQQDRDRRAGALVVADERLAVEQRDHRLRLAPDRVRLTDHDEDQVEQLHPLDHAQHRQEEDA